LHLEVAFAGNAFNFAVRFSERVLMRRKTAALWTKCFPMQFNQTVTDGKSESMGSSYSLTFSRWASQFGFRRRFG